MRKQFDLDYYLEHPDVKVVTRVGKSARILCTDLKNNDYPIAASCIGVSGCIEVVIGYTIEGKTIANSLDENCFDLFFDLPDPVKKRVPLTYDDLLERVESNKTMWVKGKSSYSLISFFYDNGYICFGDISDSTNNLMEENCYFADGDPCWKEVDSCDTCTNDKGCVTCNDGDQWEGEGSVELVK